MLHRLRRLQSKPAATWSWPI